MPLNAPQGGIAVRVATLIAAILLSSCAAPPPPERPPAPSSEPSFDAGIDYATDDLLVQLQRLPEFRVTPGLLKKQSNEPRALIAVDPTIDGKTGQQTIASQTLDSRVLKQAAAKFSQFDVFAVSPGVLGKAQYVLASTLTPLDANDATSGTFRISLSLTDIKSGFVVAQSATRVRGNGVNTTPTAFYRDSPSLTKDRAVEGQIKTAQTPSGGIADEFYMSQLPTGALISEGSDHYDKGDYAGALRYYTAAASRPGGQQLRVLNGLYLANTELGHGDDAEQAFTKIVVLGLATNSLSVKFLFRPGSLDFLANPKVSEPYSMWLRVIAREVAASKTCLTIVGHTSHTGSDQYNDRLSLQRALSIQHRIEALAPETAGRLTSMGMGFRENLVGSGTDDLRDALDRRVEFKVRNC